MVLYDGEEVLDRALYNADEEERFSLTIDLFRLWIDASLRRDPDRKTEAERVFGELFAEHGHRLVMYTVTADGQQLRVWHGRPAFMQPNHVDSCGENLLFSIVGHPEVVERYLNALCEIHRLQEIQVPNGVRLYMHWSAR